MRTINIGKETVKAIKDQGQTEKVVNSLYDEINKITEQAINKLSSVELKQFHDMMDDLNDKYAKFSKINNIIKLEAEIKEKAKQVLNASENTIQQYSEELKDMIEDLEYSNMDAETILNNARESITQIFRKSDTQKAFDNFYNAYQEVIKLIQGYINRKIDVFFVFGNKRIGDEITYKGKLMSGTQGIGAAVKAPKTSKLPDRVKWQKLFDIYDQVKDDSEKYRLNGEKSTFYTYDDTIEDAIRWFKIQSLGSLNESYASFYLNDILPKDKLEFIIHKDYGLLSVDNAPGLFQADVMQIVKEGRRKKIIGHAIKSRGASGAGFVEGMELLNILNSAQTVTTWKSLLKTHCAMVEGNKINSEVVQDEIRKQLNSLYELLNPPKT